MDRPHMLIRVATLVAVALTAVITAWTTFTLVSAGSLPQPSGDANCDGTVNSIDAAVVLQYEAGLIGSVPCPTEADASFDGRIDSLDAAIILQKEAGLLARCPDGQDSQGLVAKLVLGSNRIRFPHSEAISMTLSIINCGEEAVTRQYSSSQLYDFVVRDAQGQEVWRWSHGMGFLTVITDRTFQPGQTVTYGAVWDQETNDGEPVAPGTYEVLGYDAVCRRETLDQCDLIDSAVIAIEP